MSKQYLHFTLGPVQGFVSQARRTRDFWAGSFLLSWLTAHAMKSVQEAGGEIVMPSTKGDALLERIKNSAGKGPTIGSLPNNFIAKVDADFDGNVAVNAVQEAWKALANAVWEKDFNKELSFTKDELREVRELWEIQIGNFWDMAWVVESGHKEKGKWTYDSGALAMRKNWRRYMPPESLGDKCTMMGEWQELSGADRPNPKVQAKFWKRINHDKGLDLRENERLCAIAYVKRRFVHAWQDMDEHKDWQLPTSVPSTSYMAAVHWLEKLMQASPEPQATQDFAKKASSGERLTRIQCISDVLKKNNADHLKVLADVDGRALFESDKKEDTEINKARKAMLETVSKFDTPLSPFYAILMMDGDSLGETKAAMRDATVLSAALGEFTQQVRDIVKENNGFLIYAGGDDVLAIMPLEDALSCAAAVRAEYMAIFARKGVEAGKYSISAAIEYAHMKLPLTMILKDAHALLDDVAKDATGRDAVACRVWKPGGLQQTWAMPWDISERKKGDVVIAHAMDMITLVQEMEQRAEKKSDVGYSSKLFYNFRETLKMVLPDKLPKERDKIEALGKEIEQLQLDKLLEVTYLNSGLLEGWIEKEEGKSKQVYVREQVAKLMMLMRVYNNQGDWDGLYSSDGALLIRFLAQKGVER